MDRSILNNYFGVYKTNGEKLIISSENGSLNIFDEEECYELIPESDHDFFLREDNLQITFNENSKGQVSGLTLFIDAKKIQYKKKNEPIFNHWDCLRAIPINNQRAITTFTPKITI